MREKTPNKKRKTFHIDFGRKRRRKAQESRQKKKRKEG
jgi:hypothetical protein